MKVLGYVRVSTEEQSREGVSLDMQKSKIRAYCDLDDLELVDILEDAGISAKNITGRPGFQAALDRVFNEEADGVVVWKLDRAFRSTQDALNVAERLNKQGKALVSISEKLDTTSAIGEFFFTLMASLAQMERRLIGERTTAALQAKKAKGERVGQIPYGHDLAEDGVHLVRNEEETDIIATIKGLYDGGWSLRTIAGWLNNNGIHTKKGKTWTHRQVGRIVNQ